MGFGTKTKGKKCDWHKIGFQKQGQRRWIGNQKQNQTCVKRICSS